MASTYDMTIDLPGTRYHTYQVPYYTPPCNYCSTWWMATSLLIQAVVVLPFRRYVQGTDHPDVVLPRVVSHKFRRHKTNQIDL